MKTILCVEDDLKILYNNRRALTQNGFIVLTAESLAQARRHLENGRPDGIILDIMLPDGNGLEYLKELRAGGNNVPVLMLTAWNTEADIIRGLDLGADDYIGKPFTYGLLLSRLRKMLDHAERMPDRISRGALSLDVLSGQAFKDGADMLLSQKEFSLLLLFIKNEGRTMGADYLYEKVWGLSANNDTRALANMVYRLRKSMEGCGYDIATRRGKGYCFEAE
jgi:DNA-binding response OmpR family regulator